MKKFGFFVLVNIVLLCGAEELSTYELMKEKNQVIANQQKEIELLKAQLALMQQTNARRLKVDAGKKMDFKNWKGLRIRHDMAVVTMGKNEDITIYRSGPKKASMMGNFGVKGNFAVNGQLSVQGVDLLKRIAALEKNAGSDLKKQLASLQTQVKKLSTTVADLKKNAYVPPIPKYAWDYVKDIKFHEDGSASKTSGQGWNGAGAYTTPSCKKGNCQMTAVIQQSSNNQKNHNIHFYIHLSASSGHANQPRNDLWTCGGDRVETGSVISNNGVNKNQQGKKGDCKVGSVVSIGYETKDVVCRCNGKEYRRWKNAAKWPARAGFTIWDKFPFALSKFKTKGFKFVGKPRPIWKYKNKVTISGDGTMKKVGGQGWNGAGAYTDKTCSSGGCKIQARIAAQSSNGGNTHNLHFYVCLTTEARLADAPHGNMWCCGGDRQQNGYGYSNKGVNNDQKHANPKNKMRIGGIVSTGYEGKDVVCRVNDHEFRRWKNQAKYPVRATVSFWDAAPFALTDFQVRGF